MRVYTSTLYDIGDEFTNKDYYPSDFEVVGITIEIDVDGKEEIFYTLINADRDKVLISETALENSDRFI